MEASVILAKCPNRGGRLFGMRIQKMQDGDWWRTWAFPIDEQRAKGEGYDVREARGSLNALASYPGCPYCKARGFVQCGRCHKIICWNNEEQMTCPWCGNHMASIVTADSFDVSGGDV